MEIRNQMSMFPEINEKTGITQLQCLDATQKLFDKIARRGHTHVRQTWNIMIALLTQRMRRNEPVPDWCSLKDKLALFDEMRPEISSYLELAHKAPPCDYVGQVLAENDGCNKSHGAQFFTPAHVCEMMISMSFGGIDKKKPVIHMGDPCCGTGRFSLYTHIHHSNVFTWNNDVDMDVIRASVLTHWIYFPDRIWAFLCANSLIWTDRLGPFDPFWNYANKFDQPSWLLHPDNSDPRDKLLEGMFNLFGERGLNPKRKKETPVKKKKRK